MANNQQSQKLRDALRKHTERGRYTMAGVASNIDETAFTCTVTRANGSVYEDVQLKALKEISTGAVIIPKDGTWVHILAIGEPDYLVIACEEAAKVIVTIDSMTYEVDKDGHVFNGGDNGGITITPELKKQLDRMNTQLQTVITTLETWVPVAQDGGAMLQTTFKANIVGKSEADFSNIEDPKVKH